MRQRGESISKNPREDGEITSIMLWTPQGFSNENSLQKDMRVPQQNPDLPQTGDHWSCMDHLEGHRSPRMDHMEGHGPAWTTWRGHGPAWTTWRSHRSCMDHLEESGQSGFHSGLHCGIVERLWFLFQPPVRPHLSLPALDALGSDHGPAALQFFLDLGRSLFSF